MLSGDESLLLMLRADDLSPGNMTPEAAYGVRRLYIRAVWNLAPLTFLPGILWETLTWKEPGNCFACP